jgi:hypothetical protein
MENGQTRWTRWMRLAATTVTLLGGLAVTTQAAPIGVPAATAGAGKTVLGGEINVLMDRDLTVGNAEAEASQFFAKGTLGIDDRLDLDFRLGFGDFQASGPLDIDTDLGPAFGVGMRITWANIPDVGLKIGSVFQTTRIRAEDSGNRVGWAEYDAALGASMDLTGTRDSKPRATQFGLIPYGGFAWSGLDIDGGAAEDDAFGIFLGLGAKAQGNFQFGAEVRLIDQAALSVNAGMAF